MVIVCIMIQAGTILNVADNSGAKKVCCIKVFFGFKRRYASIGDLIMVTVKSIRKKRKSTSKAKKGDLYKALIVRTRCGLKSLSVERVKFFDNAVVLLGKQGKLLCPTIPRILMHHHLRR